MQSALTVFSYHDTIAQGRIHTSVERPFPVLSALAVLCTSYEACTRYVLIIYLTDI
jgi:hypothetical protein